VPFHQNVWRTDLVNFLDQSEARNRCIESALGPTLCRAIFRPAVDGRTTDRVHDRFCDCLGGRLTVLTWAQLGHGPDRERPDTDTSPPATAGEMTVGQISIARGTGGSGTAATVFGRQQCMPSGDPCRGRRRRAVLLRGLRAARVLPPRLPPPCVPPSPPRPPRSPSSPSSPLLPFWAPNCGSIAICACAARGGSGHLHGLRALPVRLDFRTLHAACWFRRPICRLPGCWICLGAFLAPRRPPGVAGVPADDTGSLWTAVVSGGSHRPCGSGSVLDRRDCVCSRRCVPSLVFAVVLPALGAPIGAFRGPPGASVGDVGCRLIDLQRSRVCGLCACCSVVAVAPVRLRGGRM